MPQRYRQDRGSAENETGQYRRHARQQEDFREDAYAYEDPPQYRQEDSSFRSAGSYDGYSNEDYGDYAYENSRDPGDGCGYADYGSDPYEGPDRYDSYDPEEEARRAAARRRKRKKQRLRAKKRARRRRLILVLALSFLMIFCIYRITHRGSSGEDRSASASAAASSAVTTAAASAADTLQEEAGAAATEETPAADPSSPFIRTAATAELTSVDSTIGTVDSNGDFLDDAVTIDEAKQSSIASSKAAGFSGVDNDYVASPYMILVNADTDEVIAERSATDRMFPASMTKIMTLLVAVEHLSQGGSLDDTVEITQAICDESWLTGSSYVGYVAGDTATVQDLLYGAIMPSGADAAIALADWTAGSEEAFATRMNEKAAELGISATTHFTNCVGTFDVNHYTTAQDMAVIMKTAMADDLCREVLSAHTYHAAGTAGTPDGFDLSNWFLRKIEDKDTHGTVIGAKTGYVQQSGNCAASYEEGSDGAHYIQVTGKVWDSWRCIYDQTAVYARYIPAGTAAADTAPEGVSSSGT